MSHCYCAIIYVWQKVHSGCVCYCDKAALLLLAQPTCKHGILQLQSKGFDFTCATYVYVGV